MPRDPRPYITVHDGMPDHPKVERLSDAAFRLLVTSWCWCARNHTNGEILATSWAKRGTPKTRKELVAAGLVEITETGVLCHDFTEHQRTADEIDELRQKRSDAGRKGGQAKATRQQASSKRVASASPVAKQASSKPVADTELDKKKDQKIPPGDEVAPPTGPDEPSTPTLIAEWIDHLEHRPPGQVVGQVAKQVGQMLGEGIPYADVRRGLAAWQDKGLHPSSLPSVVHEVRSAQPRRSRQQQQTDDQFARAMARATQNAPSDQVGLTA